MSGSREEERRKLADIINHWNANRLDLFEISQPTEDLEFHGVMRFYFQDRVAGNFATKCIRVSSTATTQDVIETLAEKFRPDMRMLSSPKYSLYEVHVSGEERKLDLDEKPLVVQLNWNKDDREGRFVLKNENDIIPKRTQTNGPEKQEKEGVIQNFKRTLSKKEKEKKKEKKREKEAFARIPDGDENTLNREDGENSRLAAEVYKDMPETSFTRTISNPEVVMKRRRQQKLEKRMQEFRSSDGRPDSGGTLRIYADSLKPNIPYKTILLSTTDTADFAVAEALEKYGLEKENPRDYCIARVVLPPGSQHSDDKAGKETILDDTECPLQIFRDWPSDKGTLVFQLKKRPPDYIPKKGRKPEDKVSRGKSMDGLLHTSLAPEKMPYLVELSPGRGSHYGHYSYRHHEDGSDSRDKPKLYRLQQSVTEVGSEKTDDSSIQLFGPGILPHHCDLTHTDGLVMVTPCSSEADTFVDGQRVSDTVVLRSGMTLQFGSSHVFKFVDPNYDYGMGKRGIDSAPMVKGRHKSGSVPETTFDLHGDIHSGAALPTSKSSGKLEMERVSHPSERGMVKPMVRAEQQDGRNQDGMSPELTLPASIEFRENSEDAFLSAIINYTNSSTVHFKLSPTYVLYMTCRYVMSSQYRPDMSPAERTHKVIAIVNKMVSMTEGVIQSLCPDGPLQKQKNIAGALAFWMANASELLNFIKQDKDLSRITLDAQDVLAHLVQMAFKWVPSYCHSDMATDDNRKQALFIFSWSKSCFQEWIRNVNQGMIMRMETKAQILAAIKLHPIFYYLLNSSHVSPSRAAELMTRTGSVVTLEVAKQGAIYHGLATLLNQPSPMMQRASDRGRDKGKTRPKSEGFELYNNSVQNGSPESPQGTWDSYSEPKKISGEERLLKNRVDHRSSPNVANQAQSPGGKPTYPGGPGTKITSVSTGNLCADEEPSPPRPEAYPIPTQTCPREYFTFPASKSQDRVGPVPGQPWQSSDDRPPDHSDDHHSSNMALQRITRSQEELSEEYGSYPPERLRPKDLAHVQHQREAEYQRGIGEHWNHQVSSSVESSTSSQEHLNFSSSSGSKGQVNHKSGPGRWKTPLVPHTGPVAVSHPTRTDLPPPPPPPPVHYSAEFDSQLDLPLPPPPLTNPQQAAAIADRKKREDQQRWYEKEKARLEEERDRKRREQERKLDVIRNTGPIPQNNQHGPLPPPPQHQQLPPLQVPVPMQVPQPYLPPQQLQPQQPTRPEKLANVPRAPPPPQETVIRELLPQQQPRTIERRDLQYITISKEELSSGDSLSPDPWKRDAREKLEKQQQLHIVDLLDREIQELQAKPERTAEENDRLRKLMLEWQFQKRLQESKQNEEDEEEEDDEDVDTVLIMQRLEAEKRARTAVPAISVLDLLQDEERRRKQQLEEIRKREAEDRAKQEEERRWREAEEKRRQEEEYYTRLEAERRRQHEEAERKLLTPDEPGLYRPPLPRDYQPPPPANPSTNAPPPPPQRNASYLKTQVVSPDTLYTAKFVSYNDDDDEEEEDASVAGQVKLSAIWKSYGDLPPAHKPQPQPPPLRKPRPLSDGIFLSSSFQPPAANANSTVSKAGLPPPPPAKPSIVPSGASKGFNSYTGNTAGVVGSNEVYKDPREKWTKGGQEQETSGGGGAPESLTFKERQRLFSQGKEVSNKVKASRKLMELENELNTKQ
ncbi:afadin isoform X1 [Arapaima gigas]